MFGKKVAARRDKMKSRAFQCENIGEKKGSAYNPLISIITPVFNGIKYLEICIQSVLNQDYPYIEHIFREK